MQCATIIQGAAHRYKINFFEINPYNLCVINKTINGNQFTITWHVDDLKLSHVNNKVVDDLIEWMKGLYGNDMRISRGKNHNYLGVNLDFSVKEEIMVTMVDYLKGVISDFEEVEILTGTAASPAAEHLYTIWEESSQKKLDKKWGESFRHAVAQLLSAYPRSRIYIHTAVSFLTTRVCDPDENYWVKLKRMLRYVWRTIKMPLILSSNSLTIIKLWVDTSYAVQPYMRGHTGAPCHSEEDLSRE